MILPVRTALAAALLTVAACGGKSDAPPRPPGNRNIQVSWAANHERGVNSAGGGYRVTLDGGPVIDLPYVSGAFAPTSITTTLYTGTHSVTVTAYASLDATGGYAGSASPTSTLTINVP